MKESLMMANYMAEKEIAEIRGFTVLNNTFEVNYEQQLRIRSIDGLFAAFADHDTEDWMRHMVDEDKLAEFARSYARLKEIGPFMFKYNKEGKSTNCEPLKECRRLANELKEDVYLFLDGRVNFNPGRWEMTYDSTVGHLADREVDFLLRYTSEIIERYNNCDTLSDIMHSHDAEMRGNHTADICDELKEAGEGIYELTTTRSVSQLLRPGAKKVVDKFFAPNGPGTRAEKMLERYGSDTRLYGALVKFKKCDDPVQGLKDFRDWYVSGPRKTIYGSEINEVIFSIYEPNIKTPIEQRIAEYVASKDKTVPVMVDGTPMTVHGVPVKIAVEPAKKETYSIEELVATAKAQADALAKTLDMINSKKEHDDRLI